MIINEVPINSYNGEYKKGLNGKKQKIQLLIYSDHVVACGFYLMNRKISKETSSEFHINFEDINRVYIMKIHSTDSLCIEYKPNNAVNKSISAIVLPAMDGIHLWLQLVLLAKTNFDEKALIEKKKSEEIALIQQEIRAKQANIKNTPEAKTNSEDAIDSFKLKIDKLKIMKDSGLLSDEDFENQKNKLLEEIM